MKDLEKIFFFYHLPPENAIYVIWRLLDYSYALEQYEHLKNGTILCKIIATFGNCELSWALKQSSKLICKNETLYVEVPY